MRLKRSLAPAVLVLAMAAAAHADEVSFNWSGYHSDFVQVTVTSITEADGNLLSLSWFPGAITDGFLVGIAPGLPAGSILDSAHLSYSGFSGPRMVDVLGVFSQPWNPNLPSVPADLGAGQQPTFAGGQAGAGGLFTFNPDLIAGGLGGAIESGNDIQVDGFSIYQIYAFVLNPGFNALTTTQLLMRVDSFYDATLTLDFHQAPQSVPEPGTLLLLGTGTLGLTAAARARRRAA